MSSMTNKLKELIERIETWPRQAQQEAIASLEAIEGYVSMGFSDDDIAALDRSEQDVHSGRLANDKQAGEVFDRYRRA
jgi:hypothetical protein